MGILTTSSLLAHAAVSARSDAPEAPTQATSKAWQEADRITALRSTAAGLMTTSLCAWVVGCVDTAAAPISSNYSAADAAGGARARWALNLI
jgi:hypothetical protein